MWRWALWAVVAVATLDACSDDPCFPGGRVVISSTSTEPGTVQVGLLQSSDDLGFAPSGLAVRSDGTVVCVTCAGVVALDPSLRRLGVLETPGATGVVVARDDTTFVVVPGSAPGTTDIVALDAPARLRWQSPIDALSVRLIASDDGLYAAAYRSPGPQPTLLAIDPATGAQRTVPTQLRVFGPAHRGVVAYDITDPLAVQQLDPDGRVVWSHAIRASQRPELFGSLPTADGGVLVFGVFFSDLDLGDLTIPLPAGDRSDGMILRFDATGATGWGYAVKGGVSQLATIGDDRFVAADWHQVGGDSFAPDIDSYLTLMTPAGVVRQLAIGGTGIQEIYGIAAASDGAVWIQLINVKSTDDHPEPAPVAEIGGHRVTDSGTLLFKIVP